MIGFVGVFCNSYKGHKYEAYPRLLLCSALLRSD